MIDLAYSLNIEATEDPAFYTFYSPELEGFTGVGHSVEDCLYQTKHGMSEHIRVLEQEGLPVPPRNPNPRVRAAHSTIIETARLGRTPSSTVIGSMPNRASRPP